MTHPYLEDMVSGVETMTEDSGVGTLMDDSGVGTMLGNTMGWGQ